jgi:hypothetical protein
LQDDDPPDVQVRFGQEILALDSWCRKKQYDAFCQVSVLSHVKQEIMKLTSIHLSSLCGIILEDLQSLKELFLLVTAKQEH